MGKVKSPPTEAQQVRSLHVELFNQTEGPQGDAWIADEAGTETLAEFFQFVDGHLAANIEATQAIKAFLRKHSKLRRSVRKSKDSPHGR